MNRTPPDVPLERLEAYARQKINQDKAPYQLIIEVLKGGFVAAGVYHISMLFDLPGGETGEVGFVQKYTNASEVAVMHALNQALEMDAFPALLDSSTGDPSNCWMVIPFYPGPALSRDEDVPETILVMLAQVHAYFQGHLETFNELHRLDGEFFRRTANNAIDALYQIRHAFSSERFLEAQRQLAQARENRQLYEVLANQPLTLAHGDVHQGNILRDENGKAVLIDWGNARLAPAMLDLANLIQLDSREWEIYWSAWEKASGRKADLPKARMGFHWAAVQVNLQYLPYAAAYLPPVHVLKMIDDINSAQERIAHSLGQVLSSGGGA